MAEAFGGLCFVNYTAAYKGTSIISLRYVTDTVV